MKSIRLFAFALLMLVLFACGGGPISSVAIVGRVLDITTGAPTTTVATVQTSTATGPTSLVDGSFGVGASSGDTSLIVTPPALLSYPVFTYHFPAVTQHTNDVGDLWIGPEKVTVSGVVRNAADNAAIANAQVQFAGQYTTTDSTGTFHVPDVAYSSANTTSFLGITGQVSATNFLANQFTTNGNTAVSGNVDVGTVLMTPVDSTSPPPPPFNIWGIISPSNLANGTIVTLKDTGGTVVRRFTVGTDARYTFWVNAGSYTLDFANGTHTSATQNVTLSNNSDVIRKDATLN